MTRRTRRATVFLALAAATAVAPIVRAAPHPKVKAPKSGQYKGTTAQHQKLTLYTSGKSIDLAAIQFACLKGVVGSTGLNSIPLKKGKKVYRFSIKAHGSVSFSDEHPSENAAVSISGAFSRTARSASGTLRVKSPRCHDTGSVKWKVRR